MFDRAVTFILRLSQIFFRNVVLKVDKSFGFAFPGFGKMPKGAKRKSTVAFKVIDLRRIRVEAAGARSFYSRSRRMCGYIPQRKLTGGCSDRADRSNFTAGHEGCDRLVPAQLASCVHMQVNNG